MPTAAQVLAQWLVNRGTCVRPPGTAATWPVTVSLMPDANTPQGTPVTDNFVTVYDAGDLLMKRDMAGTHPYRPNCQIKVRAKDYPTGEAKGRQIIADILALAVNGPETVTVSGTPVEVRNCTWTVGLTYMGQDPAQKHLNFFSINCRLSLSGN